MVFKPKVVQPVHVVKDEPKVVIKKSTDEVVADFKDDVVVNPTIG